MTAIKSDEDFGRGFTIDIAKTYADFGPYLYNQCLGLWGRGWYVLDIWGGGRGLVQILCGTNTQIGVNDRSFLQISNMTIS